MKTLGVLAIVSFAACGSEDGTDDPAATDDNAEPRLVDSPQGEVPEQPQLEGKASGTRSAPAAPRAGRQAAGGR